MAAPFGISAKIFSTATWPRPADWPALPALASPTQAFYGLLAVFNSLSNYVAIKVTWSGAGTISLDMGDGQGLQPLTSGTTFKYAYTYANVLAISGLLREGYAAAIVKTVVTGSVTITAIDLTVTNTNNPAANKINSWLDVTISPMTLAATNSAILPYLQNITLAYGATGNAFQNFSNIKSLSINASGATSLSNCFNLCAALKYVKVTGTSSVTDFTSMFASCTSLIGISWFDTSAGITFTTMLATCSSLLTIPPLDFRNGTYFQNIFYGCTSLISTPTLNLGTNINSGSFAAGAFQGLFYNCSSLLFAPMINLPTTPGLGIQLISSFSGCSSLLCGAVINSTIAVTSMQHLYQSCSSLETMPYYDTSNVTDFSYMCYLCSNISSMPMLNTSSGTVFTNMLAGDIALSSAAFSGTGYSISYSGCVLSTAALSAVFAGLSTTPAASQTITITGNPGEASGTSCTVTGNVLTVGGTVTNIWLPGMQVMAANDAGGPTLSGSVYYTIQPYGSASTTGTGGAGTYALTATGTPGNVTVAKTIYGVPGNTNVIIGNGWGIAS